MNLARRELLKKELDSLLWQGIIVECESPYASPVVLIPKPNGSMRLCIDNQKLNAQTVPDSYPLPRMDDLLNEAKPTPYMSTIDLRSGYHQVQVAAEDQDKTAFTCPFCIYKFTRMPFGLRNAPATFQRLIDKFRSRINNVLALSYLYDIILSPTFPKYLSDLEKASQLIQKRQLLSQICHPQPLLNKYKALYKPVPGSEQEEAFGDLKSKLASPPVLKPADGTKPFVIRTDASSVALGAVLLQGEKDEEHPIEYASRLLSSSERNYSTTEKEALAVVWALEKFRGYVEGQTIRLSSDHQPLKWLLSLKSPTGRLARWALQIQSYNLTIDYIPGRSNFIADLLSRPTSE
ncbi:retrovirus-related Pol polyprotein from transposon 297 [Trichonephila clavipes]|uniref:Retrovirus-related Pol polyprotein from transposon 297 n=1 Tax=Trichonephila clavipes TaxID=2585209 RepID=A0A8X6RAK5_TRICX|nr:retrovirus-related Pol polyprotein from transposon 297 [Trichonephila clavipes]